MNRKWLEAKTKECEAAKLEIERLLQSLEMSERDYQKIIEKLDTYHGDIMAFLDLTYMMYCGENNDFDEDYTNFQKWIIDSKIKHLIYEYREKYFLENYLDMSMEFDGDIIITDPCYIIKDEDWRNCYYGYDNMKDFGFTHYMTRDTLYGDWSCTTFDMDTKEALGRFCADAGLVSVFLLDEVLKYNPDYDWHITKPYTATVIKDFKGTVQFVVKYRKRGDGEEYYVEVIGHGMNKATGKPINFIGRQTGL